MKLKGSNVITDISFNLVINTQDFLLAVLDWIDKIFIRIDFDSVNKDLNCSRLIESGFYWWIETQRTWKSPQDFSEFKKLYEEYFGHLTARARIYYENYKIWKNIQ